MENANKANEKMKQAQMNVSGTTEVQGARRFLLK